jgi:hypothetical protein
MCIIFHTVCAIAYNVSGCLRRCGLKSGVSPDKGFAAAAKLPKHRFHRKRDQGWQNVVEQGNRLRDNQKVGMERSPATLEAE